LTNNINQNHIDEKIPLEQLKIVPRILLPIIWSGGIPGTEWVLKPMSKNHKSRNNKSSKVQENNIDRDQPKMKNQWKTIHGIYLAHQNTESSLDRIFSCRIVPWNQISRNQKHPNQCAAEKTSQPFATFSEHPSQCRSQRARDTSLSKTETSIATQVKK
jgi:hypothetical protein